MALMELIGKQTRLRVELAAACAAPVWHAGLIERLTNEIARTEIELVARREGTLVALRAQAPANEPALSSAR